MKRGAITTITLDDAVQTGDAIEGWAISTLPNSWGKRRWVAITNVAEQEDLRATMNVRYLGPCTGPKGLPGLLFDNRVTEPLPKLSVTHHSAWPL